jgi:phosphotriesterase-related protein
MDRFGLDQFLPQEKRVATIARLCEMGHADKMVLSHDASCYFDWAPEQLIPLVVPNWHFNYIPDTVISDLKAAGVTDDQVRQMTVENPRRIFERQGSY